MAARIWTNPKIKYVGSYFQGQFRLKNINNFRQLKIYVRNHTKQQNKKLFDEVLLNERTEECIWPGEGVRVLPGQGYRVRTINHFAWYHLVKQLQVEFPVGNQHRRKIPAQKVMSDRRSLQQRSCRRPGRRPRMRRNTARARRARRSVARR